MIYNFIDSGLIFIQKLFNEEFHMVMLKSCLCKVYGRMKSWNYGISVWQIKTVIFLTTILSPVLNLTFILIIRFQPTWAKRWMPHVQQDMYLLVTWDHPQFWMRCYSVFVFLSCAWDTVVSIWIFFLAMSLSVYFLWSWMSLFHMFYLIFSVC